MKDAVAIARDRTAEQYSTTQHTARFTNAPHNLAPKKQSPVLTVKHPQPFHPIDGNSSNLYVDQPDDKDALRSVYLDTQHGGATTSSGLVTDHLKQSQHTTHPSYLYAVRSTLPQRHLQRSFVVVCLHHRRTMLE